jgi:hypothetical protein
VPRVRVVEVSSRGISSGSGKGSQRTLDGDRELIDRAPTWVALDSISTKVDVFLHPATPDDPAARPGALRRRTGRPRGSGLLFHEGQALMLGIRAIRRSKSAYLSFL